MATADVQQMVQVLQALGGNDNAQRKQAEAMYEQVKATQPAQLCSLLVQILGQLQGGEHEPTRHAAAVFLWKLLRRQTTGESSLGDAPADQAAAIKQGLLQVLEVEPSGVVRRKLAETCGEVGCAADLASWPELAQALFAWSAGAAAQKETALRILKALATEEDCAEQLMADKARMAGLLQAGVADPEASVRCQAVLLVLAFVDSGVAKKTLQQMLPAVVAVVKQFATEKKEAELTEVLQELIELIEEECGWFKPQAEALLETLLQLAQAQSIDGAVRRLAFEFVLSYAEKKPKQCLKVPNFAKLLFQIAMGFMLELEEDAGWEDEDEEDEDQPQFDAGFDGVDRVAKAFGADCLPATALSLVKDFMAQSWTHKHAAVSTLRQLVETVEDEQVVDGCVQLMVQSLSDPHPRVRDAALAALAQTATDQQPYLQEKHGAALVPQLLAAMGDGVPRVQSRACAALVNLGEELEQGVLLGQLPELMGMLSQLLARPSRQVREEAITAVAVLAGVVEEHFLPYYAHVVPGLKQIVATALAKEEQKLRGKAFECLSVVGLAVGKQTFAPDCAEVMQAMVLHLQAIAASPELADDPQKSFIEEACERVCKCMKADFLPFVPALLELCFRGLAVQPAKLSRDEIDDETEDHSVKFLQDGTCTGLKTAQIEDVKACISLVQCFVEELAEHYADHIEQTQLRVFGLLDFAHDNEIRELALKTWAGLMKASKQTLAARGIADQSMHATMLRNALIKVLGVMREEGEDDGDVEQAATLAEGLANCIKEGPEKVLMGMEVATVVDKCLSLMESSFARRDAADKKKRKGKMDEDEEEELKQQKEQDEVLRSNLLQITGQLMQTQQPGFAEAGSAQRLAAVLTTLFGSKKDGDNRLAIFLACDFLEYLPADPVTAELWPAIMQKLFAGLQDMKDEELRQGAAYGLNAAAQVPQFAACAAEAAGNLAQVIAHPSSKKKASRPATDNAVAALGAVCASHPGAVQPGHWDLWLQHLPLLHDDEEGHKTHQSLLQMLQAQHAIFADPAKLSRGLEVLALVYKSDAASAATHTGTLALFQAAGAKLEQVAAAWTDKAKAKLQRIVRDAQSGK